MAWHVCLLRHFSLVQLCVTLWTTACQAPLSMRFSRQEYRSELIWYPTEDLPNPGTESKSHMYTCMGVVAKIVLDWVDCGKLFPIHKLGTLKKKKFVFEVILLSASLLEFPIQRSIAHTVPRKCVCQLTWQSAYCILRLGSWFFRPLRATWT